MRGSFSSKWRRSTSKPCPVFPAIVSIKYDGHYFPGTRVCCTDGLIVTLTIYPLRPAFLCTGITLTANQIHHTGMPAASIPCNSWKRISGLCRISVNFRIKNHSYRPAIGIRTCCQHGINVFLTDKKINTAGPVLTKRLCRKSVFRQITAHLKSAF